VGWRQLSGTRQNRFLASGGAERRFAGTICRDLPADRRSGESTHDIEVFRRRPAWNGDERGFASGITPSASKEHPLMKNTIPTIEYALEDRTDYTDSAFLVTALHWANQNGVWSAFKRLLDTDMKTVVYSPLHKVQTLLASIFVGCQGHLSPHSARQFSPRRVAVHKVAVNPAYSIYSPLITGEGDRGLASVDSSPPAPNHERPFDVLRTIMTPSHVAVPAADAHENSQSLYQSCEAIFGGTLTPTEAHSHELLCTSRGRKCRPSAHPRRFLNASEQTTSPL
jgi:hypothetical protein